MLFNEKLILEAANESVTCKTWCANFLVVKEYAFHFLEIARFTFMVIIKEKHSKSSGDTYLFKTLGRQ